VKSLSRSRSRPSSPVAGGVRELPVEEDDVDRLVEQLDRRLRVDRGPDLVAVRQPLRV